MNKLSSENQANYEFDVDKGSDFRRVPQANSYHPPGIPLRSGDFFSFFGKKGREGGSLSPEYLGTVIFGFRFV